MSFLLDTDICSAVVRDDRKVMRPYLQYSGRLYTSRIVMVELYDWAHGSKKADRRWDSINRSSDCWRTFVFSNSMSRPLWNVAGCGGWCERKGRNVGDMDLLIAGTALASDLTLVTHNVKDFKKVPGLDVQDWLA